MARKSRRNIEKNEVLAVTKSVSDGVKRMAVAAYARLSVDKEQNDSIQTQIRFLHNYIENDDDLVLYDTYVDNGYTGTNFERPEFMRMMEDARHGKVHCIVVKDLSRFGRDFLETGYYIETLLPRLNVRLISINDNFDSFREGDIDNISVPIKNMVNEMYAKDFSKKVTAYNDLHRSRGDVKLLRSVYGYKRDVENNIYVVNPDTAPIVQLIFRWCLMGVGTTKIAERLNYMKILTPLAYKMTVEKGKEFDQPDAWNATRVRDILQNEKYIGDLVWGKRRKTLFRGLPEHKTPKEEWVVWHDMHEPLVSKADFEEVQRKIESRSYRKNSAGKYAEFSNSKDYFAGKVYCADCNKKMKYMKYCYENRDGGFYSCRCKDITKGDAEHTEHWKVHADYLKIIVTDQIQNLLTWMCDKKELVSKIQKELKKDDSTVGVKRQVVQLKLKLGKMDEKLVLLYEDFSQGLLEAEDYKHMKNKKAEEREQLRKELQVAEDALRLTNRQLKAFERLESRLEEYMGEKAFQEKLVNELVDSIYISQTNGIEIRFKCADVIRQIVALEEEDAM